VCDRLGDKPYGDRCLGDMARTFQCLERLCDTPFEDVCMTDFAEVAADERQLLDSWAAFCRRYHVLFPRHSKLLLAHLLDQYCFARWHLTVCCLPSSVMLFAGRRAGRRAANTARRASTVTPR